MMPIILQILARPGTADREKSSVEELLQIILGSGSRMQKGPAISLLEAAISILCCLFGFERYSRFQIAT